MISRSSSGSMRAESAVEPTKSENITVTWRRSAAALADAALAKEAFEGAPGCLSANQDTPMPNDGYAQVLQILRGQARQNFFCNGIFAESSLVLLKAKAPQPHCQVHDSALVGRHIIDRRWRFVYRVVVCRLRRGIAGAT